MTGDSGAAAEGAVILIIGLAMYFLPTIIAGKRDHMSKDAIAVLNLLLGWTMAGWLFALIWSLTGNTKSNFMLLQPVRPVDPVKAASQPSPSPDPAVDVHHRPGLSPAAATVATVILALASFALVPVVVQSLHTPASTASAPTAPPSSQADKPIATTGGACDTFDAARDPIRDAVNRTLDQDKLALEVTSLRVVGESSPSECLVEATTSTGKAIQFNYGRNGDGTLRVEIRLTSADLR